MTKFWDEKKISWLKENCVKYPYNVLCNKLLEEFNYKVTVKTLKNYIYKLSFTAEEKEKRSKLNNQNYNHQKCKKFCACCNKEFIVPYKYRTQEFCSKKCAKQYIHKENIGKYKYHNRRCMYCGKPIPYSSLYKYRKFCSLDCYYKTLTKKAHLKYKKWITNDDIKKFLLNNKTKIETALKDCSRFYRVPYEELEAFFYERTIFFLTYVWKRYNKIIIKKYIKYASFMIIDKRKTEDKKIEKLKNEVIIEYQYLPLINKESHRKGSNIC